MARRPNRAGDSQLGLEALLLEVDRSNHAHAIEKVTAHLPDAWEALSLLRRAVGGRPRRHAGANLERVQSCGDEVRNLAPSLNADKRGMLAHAEQPRNVLRLETAALADTVPLGARTAAPLSTSTGSLSGSKWKATSA